MQALTTIFGRRVGVSLDWERLYEAHALDRISFKDRASDVIDRSAGGHKRPPAAEDRDSTRATAAA